MFPRLDWLFTYLSEAGERHHGPGAVGHGRRLQGGVEALHVVVLHPQLHVVLQRRDVDLPREREKVDIIRVFKRHSSEDATE